MISRFPKNDKEHIAGVNGQQRLLTPASHLTLIFVEVCVCFAPVIFLGTFDLILKNVCYPHISLDGLPLIPNANVVEMTLW